MATKLDFSGYSVIEQLYSGTRTLVYRGIRQADRQRVVMKLLRNEFPSFSELVQFRNQYTIAKNLNLSGIVQPYSLEPYRNSYALVMEDFGGVSLSKYSPLSIPTFLPIALQLCDILSGLYRHRVIHKDIKPANVLINPETQQIKLIDFSIASLLPRETQEVQNPSILEGTLAYLSPEQTGRMNRGIDYRSDFYSLGITFFELLTGQLPFQSKDPLELIHCHIAKQPPTVHSLNPDLPPVFSAIVTKLTAKNAEDRYQSALGLKHDLEKCLSQYQATGTIQSFALAERDICDRFVIPEKLYGRQQEVQALLDAFDRVAGENPKAKIQNLKSQSELILVAGFSGIGKTAIVNEVHKPIVRQRGYFIKGKYDQFQRNIPFSAFVQAFRDLMGQLLSESDRQLAVWKQKILAAVGENGQVMIEVIPELERLIGQQPPAPELSGDAAQNRFNRLFSQFIQVFTAPEHPLVIFIDDLQWADSASLKLMQLLMSTAHIRHLLFIAAYRDNEVTPAHPLMLMLDQVEQAGTTVNTLTLAPLDRRSVNQLVADTLSCSVALALPLTDLIVGKAQGNPFFTTQFLKVLHEDGLLTFSQDGNYWECDVAQVRSLALSDDVVEFMAIQLQKLPAATQDVLKLAACIGNQFDLVTLAIARGAHDVNVSQQSLEAAAAALWSALQEGLIIPTTETYKFFTQGSDAAIAEASANPTYKFLHDRVQQAADSLIPENQKQATHLTIGQQLLNNASDTEQDEKIFDIVNHLNQGIALITADDQRTQLAELNLKAGRKALVSTAYAAASQYFATGIQLLAIDRWQRQYPLTLALYESAVAAEYCNINFTQAQALIDVVLQQTTHLLDRVKVFELQIQIYMAKAEMPKAIEVGIATLALLGIDLDHAPSAQDIHLPTLAEVESLPPMTDAHSLAAMRILMAIAPSVYITQTERIPPIILTMIGLSLKQGYTAITAYAYAFYGMLLCGLARQIDRGYEVGWLGLKILAQFPNRELECRVSHMFNTFVKPWKQPLIDTVEPLVIASQAGFAAGDAEYASYATTHSCTHRFLAGVPLEEVQKKQAIGLECLLKIKQDYSIYDAKIWQQVVANLLGETLHPCQLQGQHFDQTELLPMLAASNNRTLLFTAYVAKAMLNYGFGQYEAAITDAENAAQYTDAVVGFVSVGVYTFYDSLSRLAVSDRMALDQASLKARQSLLDRVESNQALMRQWMAHAPANYAHKYHLVEAEKARILDHKAVAIDLYDRAITLAQANQYLNEAALANELAAKFYLQWDKPRLAQEYLTEAYYGYARWGARAKVDDLEQRYPQLLAPILQQRQPAFTPTEKIFAAASPPGKTSTSGSSLTAAIDLATVLKVSQTFSSEIKLEKLLTTLLQVMIENAGAEKCVLMLGDERLLIEGVIRVGAEPIVLQNMPVEDSQDIPLGLIYQVKHILQPAVLDHAAIHPSLATDSYILRQQPKSILCTPILNRGQFSGILYLENNLTTGAFTHDRVELLNLLCSQAAISLENARLYQESQQTLQELQRTQTQMIQAEKMSGLGQLVAGVAHEINNPVNFIFGNLTHANGYTQDLLGLLQLYQKCYPTPHPEIQQETEAIDLDFLLEDLPKLLSSMRIGAERIQKIVASLRTFSHMDEAEVKAVDIHDGIDSTLMILQHRLKAKPEHPAIEVSKAYSDLPLVECYAGQLNQVFMNVLSNAIDALEDRLERQSDFQPAITICTELVDNLLVDNLHLRVSITDNGSGIPDQSKSKLFDPFFTTKPVGKGTGMGLSISHQIVTEKHNGSLQCVAAAGQGATFIITIPIRQT